MEVGLESIAATRELAKRVVETRYEDFSSEVVEYSKKLFLSCVGAILAGSISPAGKVLTKYVKDAGGVAEAGVAGGKFRTTALDAALANGTFAHATELEDDSFPEGTFTHNVIPTALALGEKLKLPGSDILEAFVVGYEVESRTALACLAAKARGFASHGVYGTLGAAAVAAKLLKLDVEQTVNAISVATSHASGLLRQVGTGCHFIEAGLAARNGIASALLAKAGLTGNPRIVEMEKGFCDAFAGKGEYDLTGMVRDFGRPFRVMAVGIKKYPCCYEQQRVIDGVFDLIKENGFSLGDVASIDVEVNGFFAEIMRYPDPTTAEEARFSVHHSIAAVFLDKKVFMEAYTDERALDPQFREARKLVNLIPHPEWEWGPQRGVNILTFRLKDGRTFKIVCERAKGDPPQYLNTAEVVAKYESCARFVIGGTHLKKVADVVLELDKAKDIRTLMANLTFPASSETTETGGF